MPLTVQPKSVMGFVGGTLDRADHVRSNPALLAEAFADPRAGQLILKGLDPVVTGDRLAIEPLPAAARLDGYALLGIDEGGPIFVALNADAPHGTRQSPRVWELAPVLSASELALYGTARSLVDWHARHRFCAACGHVTEPHKAGWARKCGGCATEHFPRVDPVTIMLAEHDGRVLVGRQPGWPDGRYSALAGFLEPGETIEEAVARELWEEAGVRVSSVRYVASQPWPFPSSLMIACIAQVEDDTLTIDHTEIEHAFWIDADGVRASLEGAPDALFVAPPPMAVAHHLLRHWLEETGK